MTAFPNVRGIAKSPGVDRILVNGRDVTRFRATNDSDTPLRVPGYTLIEPFGYGESEPLVISRTNCNFEPYGTGDLTWLHKGARVQYQRVLEDNSIVTDYRGVVLSVQTSGRNWVAIIAGELEGRANLIDVPQALNHKPYDLGSIVSRQLKSMGLSISPAGGPTTGITMPNPGSMTSLDVLQKVCAWSRTGAVAQRAVMPWPWGSLNFRFDPKDTSTVDLTIFTDGDRYTLDLRDDVTEQPNTVFGTCITSKGLRVRGAKYPGLFQGTPAPYPFTDDRDFGTGTTDADTDTGDGISRLVDKLAWSNYLNDNHSDATTYDVYVARAVLHLQEDAGLTADGVMTPATWLALWDVDVVGFSREGARIFPFAQAARVRSYNYSSTGGILGRNPLHQPGAIRVDRTIDFGRCEKGDAVGYARDLIHHTEGHEWFGTITFQTGAAAFSGEHDNSDVASLTADDVMLARDIRPGMNAWLPYFDGGTLVHISGVQVSTSDAGLSTVTLTVDTGARDVLDISEALKRAQDSKRSFWRQWSVTNREAMPNSNFIPHDDLFGKLFNPVSLTGGQWNVVKMPIGESGTVARVDIRMDVPVEFCWAAFVKSVTEAQLDGLVGNPFTTDDDGNSRWEHESLNPFFQNRWLRIVKGQGPQPAGYSWKRGYNPDGSRTANPLTGTDLHDATWTYAADPTDAPVIYLAIYPADDCTLKRGQLFYALEDDVT